MSIGGMPRFLLAVFSVIQLAGLLGCGLGQVETRRKEIPVMDVPMQAREGEDLRKKILVLPFLDSELQRPLKVTEVARRTVLEDLVSTRQFVVIDNSDLGQDVGGFVKNNSEYDMVAVSRLASSLGIAAVIEGKILEVRARRMGDEIGFFRKLRAQVEVTVGIRVYGAKTGREILNTQRTAKVESETTRVAERVASDSRLSDDPELVKAGVRQAFREIVGSVVKSIDKLSWEGRVAMITGDKIYVNAGRISGIQVGDILKITEDGREVFDPETGSFIGFAPGRMKGTIEVVSYFGKDGAVAVVHSGSGFKENDRVEIY